MPTPPLTDEVLRQTWFTYHEVQHDKNRAAERLGIVRSTLERRLALAVERFGDVIAQSPIGGSIKTPEVAKCALPKKGRSFYYICTAAQSNTYVNQSAWSNLRALARHYGAEILVSTFTYNKLTHGKRSVKPGSEPTEADKKPLWFDPCLDPYLCNEDIEIASHLVFCGSMNILPTASEPLSGMESYAGRKSAIYPHTARALHSLSSGPGEPTKFLYTTGAVTLRNYIQKKAGQKAAHAHVYGALLVGVAADGSWFCRPLTAGANSEIYDLSLCAEDGVVTDGHRVEAVTPGDLHTDQIDPEINTILFGTNGIIDTLKPRELHLHDLLNFQRRSHHTRRSSYAMYDNYVAGQNSVTDELNLTATFLHTIHVDGMQIYVVNSNHDNHFTRWLEETPDREWRADFENIPVFLAGNAAVYEAKRAGIKDFNPLAHAMRERGVTDVVFLTPRQSHLLCPKDPAGGIECALHGDKGPNGAKPSPSAFVKMGQRLNIAHSHSTGIYHEVYRAGTSSLLDLGYNSGPSSWSHSHIVTSKNGTRTILTCWKGRWRP